jgi:hypothetical protein
MYRAALGSLTIGAEDSDEHRAVRLAVQSLVTGTRLSEATGLPERATSVAFVDAAQRRQSS